MSLKYHIKVSGLIAAIVITGCATFEPGLRMDDLMRPRQPTVMQAQDGLEVSLEEFITPNKSTMVFENDLASQGVLALFAKVQNRGKTSFKVQKTEFKVFLGVQPLDTLSAAEAADQAAKSEYVGKALGWTVATGPFAMFLWPVTIGASAAHTNSVNKRIGQYFEGTQFHDALVKPNETAGGFVYFKLPDGVKSLKGFTAEARASEEPGAGRLVYKFSLPALELSK